MTNPNLNFKMEDNGKERYGGEEEEEGMGEAGGGQVSKTKNKTIID